jgi:hypothetical protein
MFTYTFNGGNGYPSVEFMSQAVEQYILQTKGVRVQVKINMENESNELLMLIVAYKIATGQPITEWQ